MCGIAGVFSPDGIDPGNLKNMSDIIRHRGPDDEGFYLALTGAQHDIFARGNDTISEKSGLCHISEVIHDNLSYDLCLIHRRLSIIDLSPGGHQPMSYLNNRYIIVLNGEIYNYLEIKKELVDKGFIFHSNSDTEVVLAAFHCWGKDCVNHFVGMWAFAIYDSISNELFLSRDRFGIKPLYYVFKNGNFAFASEIKALLELDFVSHKGDISKAGQYLFYGKIHERNKTLFEDVEELPMGYNMTVNIPELKFSIYEYYNLESKINNYAEIPSENKVVDQFRNLFNESVRIHMRADVPVGSCLSGGLDSSAIVALSSQLTGNSVFKTFTASYPDTPVDETRYAKLVSKAFPNIEAHYTYPDVKNYWSEIGKLIWHQDLPIASTSMYSQWEVMKLVGENNIKVLLDGQGSDEILGGYYPFAGIYLIELLKKFKLISFYNNKKLLSLNFSKHINDDFLRALFHYLPFPLQNKIRKKTRIGFNFINLEYRSHFVQKSLIEGEGRSFKDFSISSVKYGLQDLLRYEDRSSMAFSIESRVPFLDHRVVEYSIALNNSWKIKDGFTKYILRKSYEPILHSDVIWRKEKFGFLTPQNQWKNEFRSNLSNYLNDFQFPDFLNKKFIVEICNIELTGNSPISEFWKLISFLKWVEIFKVEF